jgi:Rps23 Pro-64 3,4-dihydroxylase Tpa1-like proline 4-hydroxylase
MHEGGVSVTLLLAGGHSRTLFLSSSDPLLGALLSAMSEKGQSGRPPGLFNIRVDEGRHSLLFSPTDLVGLLTDPPIVQDAAGRPTKLLQSGEGNLVRSPHAVIENFIDPVLHKELLSFVGAHERDFAASSVSTKDEDYRRSLVLQDFPKFSSLFRERVRALVPQLVKGFGMGEFPVAEIECQLTAHNDGHYYKPHNDSGSADTLERTISYVFYFYNEPKGFSGGELRLYNSRMVNGQYERADFAADIEPKNNSILFFPSICHHEVLPVRCPSKRFSDSRFTINGWVRKARA